MEKVIGVKFKNTGKLYYFDPGKYSFESGDNVIVETSRGLEFGIVKMECIEIDESEIVAPLKKIVRPANEKDCAKHLDNLSKSEDAMRQCQEKIYKHGLEMRLTDVEYTFDNSKLIFYFTADGRVDFRELVKDLAAIFHTRIELRQIGVRDEAKMLGGIGSCGRPFCCHSWLPDFEPVSIKMAKVQNLSLNPAKISGICGRLMCCLNYENAIYTELRKGMPNVGEKIKTPDGMAIVFESNILENKIKTRLILDKEDGDDSKDDKLSSEFYEYTKAEIKRLGYKGKKNRENEAIGKEMNNELMDEIKNILKNQPSD